ncbi:MAG: hypothetical protein JNK15_21480 [Planctomycetes bacterium]|nr:hypothetical protein [Planctomycetota bacterium]
MPRRSLAVALIAAPVLAQSNAVSGLDILMYDMTDLAYYGRQGAAYPNGEAGFMVGHSWCNAGSVNLPWVSQSGGLMVDQYPRIAFLLARESGGRMVQVTSQGHSKHSPTAYNFQTGPCLPCNSGGGSFFFTGCSDTYGSGINSGQYVLGPNHEINPWLGTWNPVGSYFDRGDPAVVGPAAVDGARSLTSAQVAAFNAVKNRMVVREGELLAGAAYYAQVQAVVQGEPLVERGNNIANRACTISGGPNWICSAQGSSMTGSVLTRWSGATTSSNSNGTDDGQFVVGVKVTGPTNGLWHYEYAVHNVDNFRGGASFKVPVAAGATVSGLGFRDLDTDPLNDWTSSVSANEIAFAMAGTNSLDWNTIYNFWFDCSIPPGAGAAVIEQARPGTGGLTVQVLGTAPSGLSFANKYSVGNSSCGVCRGSFYELWTPSSTFDMGGRSMTLTLVNGAYSMSETPVAFVPLAGQNLNFAFNQATAVALPFTLAYPGGTTNQLHVSASGYVSPGFNANQLVPSASLLLSGQPRWAGVWAPFAPTGANNVYADVDASRAILTWNAVPLIGSGPASTFQMQFFPNGTVHVVWQSVASSAFSVMSGWSTGGGQADPGETDLSAALPAGFSLCAAPFDGLVLGASANPVLGTTLQWQLGGIPAGTGVGALFRSLTQATPAIDLTSIGMPGCQAHVVLPDATAFLAPPASLQIAETIPNVTALVGVTLVGQAVTFNPGLTPLGFVASNGMVLTLGL